MTKLNFICEFKSDIVLHSSSNTEGKVDMFDYIAGSNFLGMVARKYGDFGSDAFEVFHAGAVRFGDGHILEDNQETFQVPFAWFAPKGVSLKDALEKKELYNEHFLTKEQYDAFIQEGKQLKQQRAGFVTANGALVKVEHNYRQKSAYDKKNRRSQDSTMFGYYSLSKGTKWAFSVEMDNDKYKDEIIKILKSSKRLGKSRSAEYGRVKIKFVDKSNPQTIPQALKPIKIDSKHYIFLYAKSRLALTNNGINSYQFDLASLGLEESSQIAWSKSQIRTSRYTPYVAIRDNRDPERLIIDKGSVIAIEVNAGFDVKAYSEKVEKGLGLYLSEGHGKVVVNPKFLTEKNPKFDDSIKSSVALESEASAPKEGAISQWLKTQQEQEKENYKLLNEVKEFIKKHNVKNKKAQWGQIRSMCSAFLDSDRLYEALFSEEMVHNHQRGFLLHGHAKKKWDKSQNLIDALKEKYKDKDIDYHAFIKLLSIYAPKEDDKKGENNE